MDLLVILAIYLAGVLAICTFTSPARARRLLKPFGLALDSELTAMKELYLHTERKNYELLRQIQFAAEHQRKLEAELDHYTDAVEVLFPFVPICVALEREDLNDDKITLRTQAIGNSVDLPRHSLITMKDLPNFLAAIRRKLVKDWVGTLAAELERVLTPEGIADALMASREKKRGTR